MKTNLRKLADVKEALLSGTLHQKLSVSLESLLTSGTVIRKLADVKEALLLGISQQKRCQCHSNHC